MLNRLLLVTKPRIQKHYPFSLNDFDLKVFRALDPDVIGASSQDQSGTELGKEISI